MNLYIYIRQTFWTLNCRLDRPVPSLVDRPSISAEILKTFLRSAVGFLLNERPSALHFRNCQLKVLRADRPQRGWVVCGIVHKAACKNQSEDIGDIDRISRPTSRRRSLKEEQETKGRETAANLLIALCPVAIIPVPVPVPVPVAGQRRSPFPCISAAIAVEFPSWPSLCSI